MVNTRDIFDYFHLLPHGRKNKCDEANKLIQIHGEVQVTSISSSMGKKSAIKVFPNPFEEVLTIDMNSESKGGEYFVEDLRGRVLHKGTLSSKRIHQVTLNMVPKGIYFIRIETGTQRMVEKVMKK